MLDLRIDYQMATYEDRLRATRDQTATANRGVKRLFRLPAARPIGRRAEQR